MNNRLDRMPSYPLYYLFNFFKSLGNISAEGQKNNKNLNTKKSYIYQQRYHGWVLPTYQVKWGLWSLTLTITPLILEILFLRKNALGKI